jgi:deoxyribose-phosphate aldolase
MTRDELAAMIDHTILKPEAAAADIDRLCDEAIEWGLFAVCVNPMFVARAARRTQGKRPVVVSVAGFPLGASTTVIKAEEARRVIADGAAEVDMVLRVGDLRARETRAVRDDIAAVVDAARRERRDAVVKVILETAALTDEQIIAACRCCAEAQADFAKTSTGFHPGGGATVAAVRLMHKHAAPIRVKASGGIRDWPTAKAMIEAGASRIGTSSGAAILRELISSGGRP